MWAICEYNNVEQINQHVFDVLSLLTAQSFSGFECIILTLTLLDPAA